MQQTNSAISLHALRASPYVEARRCHFTERTVVRRQSRSRPQTGRLVTTTTMNRTPSFWPRTSRALSALARPPRRFLLRLPATAGLADSALRGTFMSIAHRKAKMSPGLRRWELSQIPALATLLRRKLATTTCLRRPGRFVNWLCLSAQRTCPLRKEPWRRFRRLL